MYVEKIAKVISEVSGADNIEDKIEVPPDSKLGDYALPCFILAKQMKKSPQDIAKELAEKMSIEGVEVKATGPYLNFFVNVLDVVKSNVSKILEEKENYGDDNQKSKVLVESPGPNTNKPLHLGHLRNILLGSSITNILKKLGKEVHVVNVVNDRGVHICKSMLAYQKLGEGKTPESENRKPDHFVGDYYVKFSEYAEKNETAEDEVQKMLIKWEEGDKEVRRIWKQMNSWAYEGWDITYKKLEFEIEKEYYESETYAMGKEIIQKGLADGLFEKDENGSIIINLEEKKLGTKVLLRSNGTSVYITQDINMAKLRYEDFKFDEMIYVVGNEQEYHFNVLFEVFKKLGWEFADKCYHFSYGMVELPEGKMKSREGTVIDTDDVIENMYELSKEEVLKRYDDLSKEEVEKRANLISMGAIRFFFLKNDALKNFVFNPKESLAFEGETGPYVQYTHARICSILRKANLRKANFERNINYDLLNLDDDKELAKCLAEFPEIVKKAGRDLKPNFICYYLIKISQQFNNYYAHNKVIQEDKDLQTARLGLLTAVRLVLANGLELLCIKAPEEM